MDQLQGRFGGSDLVAIAMGLLSFVVSIVLFLRQNRLDAKSVAMQERLTAIEEARHRQEMARAIEADVRVSLRGSPKATGRGKNYHLFFENKGEATAHDVEMTEIVSIPPGGPPVSTACDIFPVASLRPGDSVNCAVSLVGGHGPSFDVTVSWTDSRGRQTETQRVTPGS